MVYNDIVAPSHSKNKIRILELILLAIYFLSTIKCTSDPPPNRLMEIANKQFNKSFNDTLIKPDTIKLVLDISESMKGFANTGTFRELISKTKFALGPSSQVSFYRLDNKVIRINDFLQFFDPTMFSSNEADFDHACRLKRDNPKDLLVLITDLQFNDDRRYINFVDTFQREIMKKKYIKIFSAKPDFKGTIFPQFNNQTSYYYSGQRPLYAIVIGEREHVEFIEQIFKKSMPWENTITLSGNTTLQSKIFRSNANMLKDFPFVLSINTKDSLSIAYKIIGSGIYEWEEWSKDEIQSEIYEYRDTNFVFVKDKSLTTLSVATKQDTCTMILHINNIDPQPTKLIRILLKPNNIPSWISQQSCDVNGNQASHTVRLKNFINDVISNQNNQLIVSTFHVFLKEK